MRIEREGKLRFPRMSIRKAASRWTASCHNTLKIRESCTIRVNQKIYSLLIPLPTSFRHSSHIKSSTISTHTAPSSILILHHIQIRLHDILDGPTAPSKRPRAHCLDGRLPRLAPKLRVDRTGRDEVNTQRLQIDSEVARHGVQPASQRADHRPVRQRPLRHRARGERERRVRAGLDVRAQRLRDEQRAPEPHRRRLLDARDAPRVGRHHRQRLARRVHRVVELAARHRRGDLGEEPRDVGLERLVGAQVAHEALRAARLAGVGVL